MSTSIALLRTFRWVRDRRDRVEVRRHVIRAAFEIGFEAKWSRTAPDLTIEESPRLTWQIGEMQYIFLPRITRETVLDVEGWHNRHLTHLIVPSSRRLLLELALQQQLANDRPSIFDFPGFLALRMLFSSCDAGWSSEETLRRTTAAYNRSAVQAGVPESLLIAFPPALKR